MNRTPKALPCLWKHLIRVVGIALCLTLTACTVPAKQPRPYEGEFPARVLADWNDIPAAMSRSRVRTESIAVNRLDTESPETGSIARYEVISIRDHDIILEFRTRADWRRAISPIPIEIEAFSRIHDDEAYRRAVVGEVKRNLEALAGVDVAPHSE